MTKFLLPFIIMMILHLPTAQTQDLPRGFAPGELSEMPGYIANVTGKKYSRNASKPEGPVRSMAEWEELSGLIISWTPGFADIQTEIVRHAQQQCTVIIACVDSNTVKNHLKSKNIVDTFRIKYVVASYNSIWVRDYGPNSVYFNDVDSLAFTDWIYNRPRYRDDSLARTLAAALGVPLFETNSVPDDLVHTGGNYMSDGLGLAFSSRLVLDENGPGNLYGISAHNEQDIDRIMQLFMGTNTYPKMINLPYDGIHHIDMHMKILDEQRILVGRYDNDVADGAQINANIDYLLSNFNNSFGKPFQIFYIPMPPDDRGRYPHQSGHYRTYTNSVMVNKLVLVPFYEEKYDTTAQRIYEELLPGYKIQGIDCNSIIPSSGAIHCITKEVGTKDPLLIAVNTTLPEIEAASEAARTVQAIVKHRSGIDFVWLYYRSDNTGADYDSIEMTLIDVDRSLYEARLPVFANNLYYYIGAQATSGKTGVRPATAPTGNYTVTAFSTNTAQRPLPKTDIVIFPNPSRALTCAEITSSGTSRAEITLSDYSGRTVIQVYRGELSTGTHKYFFQASDLQPGVYFLQVKGDTVFGIKTVIVM